MKTKKILIIDGHPDAESYVSALGNAYQIGVLASGADIKKINIRDLNFNPNLTFGYRKRTELEPDLVEAQKAIVWADHIVWLFPVWWGGLPAILKGFIDRAFLPGFAFSKIENSLWWNKLLKGKTAHIIATLDQPSWFYTLFNHQPTVYAMKRMTLQFVGISKVKVTNIGPIRLSKDSYREKWLQKIENYGLKNL